MKGRMNAVKSRYPRSFNFPISTLVCDAQLLLAVLQDDGIGLPVAVKMAPTFVADFTSQIALVVKLGTDQTGAVGSISSLTSSQTAGVSDLERLMALARRAGKDGFPGQRPLLRSEFQVGGARTRNFAIVLERGKNLLAACQKYAPELAPVHWSAADTDELSAALDSLEGIDGAHAATTGGKLGLTEQRDTAANQLFRQCVAVQARARLIYPFRRTASDPGTAEARQRFLLGVFPPRRGALAPATPPPIAPENPGPSGAAVPPPRLLLAPALPVAA
jgi:hypothetical protein